jgi:hypothetical protein
MEHIAAVVTHISVTQDNLAALIFTVTGQLPDLVAVAWNIPPKARTIAFLQAMEPYITVQQSFQLVSTSMTRVPKVQVVVKATVKMVLL